MEPVRTSIVRFAIAGLIFVSVAVVAIAFIFSPVKNVTEFTITNGETIIEEESFPALSLQGGSLLAESWKKYPNYTIGLGVAGGLSLGGFVYCFFMMDRIRREAKVDL